MKSRFMLGAALAAGLLVSGCGSSSTPAPSAGAPTTNAPTTATTSAPATSVPTAVVPPSASSEPSSPPAPSASAGASASATPTAATPSLSPGQAADLEALLPSTVNGAALTKESFDGAAVKGAVTAGASLDKLLADNGKTVADLRVATASSGADSPTVQAALIALQIKGLAGTVTLAALKDGMGAPSLAAATIGGKSVLRETVTQGEQDQVIDLYVKDDVLYDIMLAVPTGDTAIEASVLQALP
jgi:hypothetical protein